jgi:hypothetical protein
MLYLALGLNGMGRRARDSGLNRGVRSDARFSQAPGADDAITSPAEPVVRIPLPPADSPGFAQTQSLQVEKPGFRAGVPRLG